MRSLRRFSRVLCDWEDEGEENETPPPLPPLLSERHVKEARDVMEHALRNGLPEIPTPLPFEKKVNDEGEWEFRLDLRSIIGNDWYEFVSTDAKLERLGLVKQYLDVHLIDALVSARLAEKWICADDQRNFPITLNKSEFNLRNGETLLFNNPNPRVLT